MKKAFLIICLMCALSFVYAQENVRKIDYKIGWGLSIVGKGMIPFCLESELNFKLSNYFSTSVFVDLGSELANIDVGGRYHQIQNVDGLMALRDSYVADYLQTGVNFFISPFKNDKRNNFKIGLGVGLSLLKQTNIYDIYVSTGTVHYDKLFISVTEEIRETSLMVNLILEDEYWINSRFSIGGKIYTTARFVKGGLMGGAMVKLGIAL